MALTHITDEARTGKGVTGLSDTPGLTTAVLQEKFDELGNLAIDGTNKALDELESKYGASNIGAIVPSGISASDNVQGILNAMAFTVNSMSSKSHQHANKAVLDGITQSLKDGYDKVSNTFSGADTFDQTVEDSKTSVPSGAAIVSYLKGIDAKKIIVDIVYPVGSVYMSAMNISPSSVLGGTWETINPGIASVFAWKRTK